MRSGTRLSLALGALLDEIDPADRDRFDLNYTPVSRI
jgi:hypothetical protein